MMKRMFFAVAVAALTAACAQSGKYVINGRVDGAADGDSVFLQEPMAGGRMAKVAGAAVKDGRFTMEGRQEQPALRYLTYEGSDGNGSATDFFLENGAIEARLTIDDARTTGTPNNDAYQAIKDEMTGWQKQMDELQESASPERKLSEAEEKELMEKMGNLEEQMIGAIVAGAKKNMGNAAGIHLLKQFYYYMMDSGELAEVVALVSEEQRAADPTVAAICGLVAQMEGTAVGKRFTDFELNDPNGKPVKLSDYAGKGKVVLVDFWASWCGPCRQEMPSVVKVYDKYKDKGLEIVGVSLDRTEEAWKKGIADLGITWPQMSDLKYWDCLAADLYAVKAIPHTVLIDKDGTIIAKGLRGEKLYDKIAGLLD